MPINVIKTPEGFKPTKVVDGKEVADHDAKLVHTGDSLEAQREAPGEAYIPPDPTPAEEAPVPEKKGFLGKLKDMVS